MKKKLKDIGKARHECVTETIKTVRETDTDRKVKELTEEARKRYFDEYGRWREDDVRIYGQQPRCVSL